VIVSVAIERKRHKNSPNVSGVRLPKVTRRRTGTERSHGQAGARQTRHLAQP
jgi:hypothetical protein